MKVFICAVIALAVLVSGIVWFCIDVENVCNLLLSDAEILKDLILKEETESAEKLVSDMQKIWEKHTPFFMAFSEHNDINSVADSLSDIENRLFFRDFQSAYCSLSDFKHKVSCIASDSKPTLINIF